MTGGLSDILATFSQRRPQFPHTESSLGMYLGRIQNKDYCWEAIGEARSDFAKISPKIKEYLQTKCPDPIPESTWVTWSIFMIGRSPRHAAPTIMFCSTGAGPRKQVRNAVKDSGILKDYPGFKTAHLAEPPEFENLVQLAKDGSSALESPGPSCVNEILYDLAGPIRSTGMHLYVRKVGSNTGSENRVTASVLQHQTDYYFLMADHTLQQVVTSMSMTLERDDEYEIDSNDEYNPDDDFNIAITSRGSASPDTSFDCDTSNSDLPGGRSDGALSLNCLTRIASDPNQSSNQGNSLHDLQMTDSDQIPFESSRSPILRTTPEPRMFSSSSLQPVGRIELCSTNKDWCLVKIEDPSLLRTLASLSTKDQAPIALTNSEIGVPSTNAKIRTWTASGGSMTGTISGSPSYMSLPGSSSYEEVYTVRLEGMIKNGDCGSLVFNDVTGELYGHIVAGSEKTNTAYIMAAHHVFPDIEKRLIDLRSDERTIPESTSVAKVSEWQSMFPNHANSRELEHTSEEFWSRSEELWNRSEELCSRSDEGSILSEDLSILSEELWSRGEEMSSRSEGMSILSEEMSIPSEELWSRSEKFPSPREGFSSRRKRRALLHYSKSGSSSSGRGATAVRAFPCPLAPYGCDSAFPSKNEWKRHVGTQHVKLGVWRCTLCQRSTQTYLATSNRDTAVQIHNDFNRKDLFTQHLRRMHPRALARVNPAAAPPEDVNVDVDEDEDEDSTYHAKEGKDPASADPEDEDARAARLAREDAAVNHLIGRCFLSLRAEPTRCGCPLCDARFEGSAAWEQRIDHLAAHLENLRRSGHKVPRAAAWKPDHDLEEYLLEEGLIEAAADGRWKIGRGVSRRASK